MWSPQGLTRRLPWPLPPGHRSLPTTQPTGPVIGSPGPPLPWQVGCTPPPAGGGPCFPRGVGWDRTREGEPGISSSQFRNNVFLQKSHFQGHTAVSACGQRLCRHLLALLWAARQARHPGCIGGQSCNLRPTPPGEEVRDRGGKRDASQQGADGPASPQRLGDPSPHPTWVPSLSHPLLPHVGSESEKRWGSPDTQIRFPQRALEGGTFQN